MTNDQIPMTNGGEGGNPPSVFQRTCITLGHLYYRERLIDDIRSYAAYCTGSARK